MKIRNHGDCQFRRVQLRRQLSVPVEGFETLEFTVGGNEYTVSGLSASVSGTDAGTYPSNVTGTAKVTDAAGNDVTSQFSVTTEAVRW